MKILLVEDSKELNEAISEGLDGEGYIVDSVLNGAKGWEFAVVNDYDLIILDLNLPELSGYEVAKKIREKDSSTPIIAVTARDALKDKLQGFEIGFDDYITKPFSMRELFARVRVLIKRAQPVQESVLELDDIVVDTAARMVTLKGGKIDLTKTEYNILEYLAYRQGIVVKKTELMEKIWGADSDLLSPPVRSHIKNLRKKLGDDDLDLIKTVPGVGYIIE